jgi:hypothetical protein
MNGDRIARSARERDRLKVMSPVLEGKRTQAEAGRLMGLCVRQVRRLQRRLESGGDAAIIHGLRGRPSNRRRKEPLRRQVVDACCGTLSGGAAPATPGVCRFQGPRQMDGKRKAAPPKRHGLVPYVPPKGARVALLRSPILPMACLMLPPRSRTVQARIIPGEKASNSDANTGHFYWVRTPDISNGP